MDFLKEYTVSIMVVSIVAILLENLLPQDNNKKYCNVMIGLFVMLVILTPLTRLPHYDETFSIPALKLDDSDLSPSSRSYVAESFEKNLALSISQDLHGVFDATFECRVFCDTNDEGQITDISRIQIAPFSQEISAYIAEKYGIKEAIITP